MRDIKEPSVTFGGKLADLNALGVSACCFFVSACVFLAMPFCAAPFCSTAAIFVELFGIMHTLPGYSKVAALVFNFGATLDKNFIWFGS